MKTSYACSMTSQRLTPYEQDIKRWRIKLVKLVNKLARDDKRLTNREAVILATKQVGPFPRKISR